MAKSIGSFTFENGFKQPAAGERWRVSPDLSAGEEGDYVTPQFSELQTSSHDNDVGQNALRTWPTIYDGTNAPSATIPRWWRPSEKGVSFRIIDAGERPLLAGRADSVQPRYIEVLQSWGLAEEVADEGPLINSTAFYKDGKKLMYGRSQQSDSRYRGLSGMTQGQLERIYVRDLLRHRSLVERSTRITNYSIDDKREYPVSANVVNVQTGKECNIQAKHLVGCDGASSTIRKQLGIKFEGITTNIHWGIIDCVFESDHPHAWTFGGIVSSTHGGCVVIPREEGSIRLCTQLDISETGLMAQNRRESNPASLESDGRVKLSSITPDEVLEQAQRVFAPYYVRFAAPISWFAIWKVSERLADSFSSRDLHCHLVGDAAHVHSAMGGFGLNASIIDSTNLAWKLGLCCRGLAKPEAILPTYTKERRLIAKRIIETSGTYLRFVCGTSLPLAKLSDGEELGGHQIQTNGSHVNGVAPKSEGDESTLEIDNGTPNKQTTIEEDLKFMRQFFMANGAFFLGLDAPYPESVLAPSPRASTSKERSRAVAPYDGVRAPNPRVCFTEDQTGYLYDKMKGADRFHIIAFLSNMQGRMRSSSERFLDYLATRNSFYNKFGGNSRFNVLLVVKCLPFELPDLVSDSHMDTLRRTCNVVFDDRAPDEDAHTTYGVDHHHGAVVAVRPDLWIGTSTTVDEASQLEGYFDKFLQPTS
ncbi:MAG: hypothetical protein Q9162_000636 [Coniocarpon cinnabarinum]